MKIPSWPRLAACSVFAVAFGFALRAAENAPALRSLDEPDPAREARVQWHRDARFGCFVHWGVYADLAGEWQGKVGGGYSEHIMRQAKIPRQVYLEQVARPFNPVKFDADAWVRLMRDTGMRYLIITAKHHDGFAMYPSAVSDFDLADATKFSRDPMRELKDACAKYGLHFGFYYSHAFDWEHPDAPGNDWDYGNPGGDRLLGGRDWWTTIPEFVPRARKYVTEKSIPQIEELIANYRPAIMWFDTPHKLPPDENMRILAALRAADPNVVVNGRLVRSHGDYVNTGDRPAYFPEVFSHWESIPTTNESYGYHQHDKSHKTPAHFVQLLALTVGKGGNMLLNLGPRGDGSIDPVDVEIMRGVGAWMRRNGESIHGADRTPLAVQPWGASTRKGRRLYLHVFRWPADGRLVVGGLRSNPMRAHLLGASAGETLAIRRRNLDDLEIAVPAAAPDEIDSVVVLDFPAEIAASKAIRLAPESGAATALHVFDGRVDGRGIRFGDGKTNRDVTEEWTDTSGTVTWIVRTPEAGRFRVAVNYNTGAVANTDDTALQAARDGAVAKTGAFVVSVAHQQLAGTVTRTASTTEFRTDALGECELPAGEHALTIRATEIPGRSLMRLRQIELTAVR